MQNKIHEIPEFQVIKLNEANAKFYAASGGTVSLGSVSDVSIDSTPATTVYNQSNTNGWF